MRKRRTFTKTFKAEAVRLLEQSGKPASELARELGVPRNRLYKWQTQIRTHGEHSFPGSGGLAAPARGGGPPWRGRPESQRVQANRTLLLQIRRIHVQSREAYGAVKTWRTLTAEGVPCGRHRVRRLRRAHGIEARRMRRFRAVDAARNGDPPAPNQLARQFDVPAPNRVWAGDIPFIPTRRGWLY